MLGLVAARSVPVRDDLLGSILSPYREACRYLRRATVDFAPGATDDASGGAIVARGDFEIPASFYIDDTGHFNAVEFNLCFNQLGYVFLAFCVEHRLVPAMRALDLATYKARQLSGVLIAELRSSFQRAIDARRFRGAVSIARVEESRNYWAFQMPCEFADEARGHAQGEVKVVILKPR